MTGTLIVSYSTMYPLEQNLEAIRRNLEQALLQELGRRVLDGRTYVLRCDKEVKESVVDLYGMVQLNLTADLYLKDPAQAKVGDLVLEEDFMRCHKERVIMDQVPLSNGQMWQWTGRFWKRIE